MDKHTLDILEYAKVKSMLSGYAACGLGRAEVEALEPMNAPHQVRRAVEETTEFRDLIETRGRLPFAGMSDVRPAIGETEGGDHPLEPHVLRDVRNTLMCALEFKQIFKDMADARPRLAALGEGLEDFTELCDLIDTVIARDGTVADDASPALARLRSQIEAVSAKVRDRAYALARSAELRSLLQTENVGIRRDRYVLAVRVECKHQVAGIIHDRSQTGSTVYIEPRELVVLANELDDLRFEERREVTRLLWELTMTVREQRDRILPTLDVLARIDGTHAKARFSMDYGMSAPAINDDGHLNVRRARHPILVRVLERSECAEKGQRVVPIDYRLGEDFDLLVITGPNTGGKTVALKTIGLLALMAQSGMHVPAEPGSAFPCYDNVLADIGDEQSIEQSLSTFSSHVTNIVRILKKAHSRTLVLLDELGSGTDPAEGGAIGTAVLDLLREHRAKTVVTTHIGDLKAYAYHHERTLNAACEFDERSLEPSYRLLLGQPGNSNAVRIAERLGMPRHVVRRARGILQRRKGRGEDMIADLQRTRRAIEDDRETAFELKKEAEALHEKAESELRAAKAKGRASRREAEHALDEQLKEVRARVRAALVQLQNAPAPFADRARDVEEALDRAIESTPLAARRLEFAQGLRRGDFVYVIPFGESCRVRSINKGKQRLTVVLGHSVVEVSFDDVSWLSGE